MPYASKDAHVISQWSKAMDDKPIVWLTEERKYAYLLSVGAYVSRVYFVENGIEYDIYVENDEYILMEEPFTHEWE